jgi:hypothetical protein
LYVLFFIKALDQVLRVYVEHYNAHRPHRALELNHQPRPPV